MLCTQKLGETVGLVSYLFLLSRKCWSNIFCLGNSKQIYMHKLTTSMQDQCSLNLHNLILYHNSKLTCQKHHSIYTVLSKITGIQNLTHNWHQIRLRSCKHSFPLTKIMMMSDSTFCLGLTPDKFHHSGWFGFWSGLYSYWTWTLIGLSLKENKSRLDWR